MIDKYPKTCNLCGGRVEYISNAKIYGRPYGSGYCYHCTACGATWGHMYLGQDRRLVSWQTPRCVSGK